MAEATATATAAPTGASASSGQAAPAQGAAADKEEDDCESDITGTLSENEHDDMDIEEVVSKVPADQKANVRAILEVRKARTAKRLQLLTGDATASRAARRRKK